MKEESSFESAEKAILKEQSDKKKAKRIGKKIDNYIPHSFLEPVKNKNGEIVRYKSIGKANLLGKPLSNDIISALRSTPPPSRNRLFNNSKKTIRRVDRKNGRVTVKRHGITTRVVLNEQAITAIKDGLKDLVFHDGRINKGFTKIVTIPGIDKKSAFMKKKEKDIDDHGFDETSKIY